MSTRIDSWMVENGLAASRTQAQELIRQGRVIVSVDGRRETVRKPSQKVEGLEIGSVEVLPAEDDEFVSRGGLKMRGALDQTGLDVRNLRVLDIGISTGGFTDCLLQRGAREVLGVDVGHGQLASRLRGDPRVTVLEGVNARALPKDLILGFTAGHKFDLIVVDVSFISLELVLPQAIQYLGEAGHCLALVKPQFEVGREGLGKGGIVKDPRRLDEVREKILRLCERLGVKVEDYFASAIEGGDGNKEFFVWFRWPSPAPG